MKLSDLVFVSLFILADAAAHQVPVLDLVLDVPGDVVAGQDQVGRQDEDGDEC